METQMQLTSESERSGYEMWSKAERENLLKNDGAMPLAGNRVVSTH